MPTILTNGIQLPDKGSVDWYSSMQSNYNLIDTHLGNTDIHVTTEDKANWDSKASGTHTHTSSELTDIGDYATKQYVDNSISGLVDNAPDALNTLNELSAALNDDSNFASTVTTALGNKANSADLATVATSGSYNDLSDKPTINDSTITIQKNGSTVDTFTTNGSDKTINITVPTKTSDITNDSNFVVSSNLATVATSGDYDDLTDLPTYGITRFCSSAITDNSSVGFSSISSTNKIKVGDFLLDTVGKMYQISAVDTANETVSVTTPLTQLAVDSNVVHKSGNETVSGSKIFSDDLTIYSSDTTAYAKYLNLKNQRVTRGSSEIGTQGIQYQDKSNKTLTMLESRVVSNGNTSFNILSYNVDGNNQIVSDGVSVIKSPTTTNFAPTTDNAVTCGRTLSKWSDVLTYKVNSLEPSSLSLPSDNLNDVIDISGYLTVLDGSNVNTYVAPANGWISILMNNSSGVQGYITGLWGHQIIRPSLGSVRFFMPVLKNKTINILVLGGTIGNARFIPCQGNV